MLLHNFIASSTSATAKNYLLIASVIVIFVLYKANNRLSNLVEETENELNRLAENAVYPMGMRQLDFEGFDNNTGTENGCYLVPNIVHFMKLDKNTFNFIEMICILAAYKRQRPELLYIHTNVVEFVGKYWDYIKNIYGISNVLMIRPITLPNQIYNSSIPEKFHQQNILRINILMEFGGIFLNNDMYLVKNVNDFRRYEMTVGWKTGKMMDNNILIAHKDARFLKEYLLAFQNDHRLTYIALLKPITEILNPRPYLVHRVERNFGTYVKVSHIYLTLWKDWRHYYSLHLLMHNQYFLETVSGTFKYPKSFEDYNIGNYKNITFYEMVNDLFDVENRRVR